MTRVVLVVNRQCHASEPVPSPNRPLAAGWLVGRITRSGLIVVGEVRHADA